jgi:phospholipid transport system substrate-binding protein
MTRRLLLAAVFLAFAGVATAPRLALADDGTEAKQAIQSLAEQAITALTSAEITRTERHGRFRELLVNNVDIKTIGPWVLGRAWAQATEAQKKEYLGLFEALIVGTYADRFERYAGEKLVVNGATGRPGEDTVVQSYIDRPQLGQKIRVDWRMHRRDGKLWIVDVIVEGVSLGVTQRSEFASAIKQMGGFEPFLAELRKRADAANGNGS